MCLSDLKAPDTREELTVTDYAHDRAMRREQKVVEAHSGLWCFGVPVRVLRLYGGRVEKRGRGDGVHAKAENIERREVYRKAERRFALIV